MKVHYRGTLENGQEFDSSHKRGQPATFPLSRVIPCWTEGVQKIKVGGKAAFVGAVEFLAVFQRAAIVHLDGVRRLRVGAGAFLEHRDADAGSGLFLLGVSGMRLKGQRKQQDSGAGKQSHHEWPL